MRVVTRIMRQLARWYDQYWRWRVDARGDQHQAVMAVLNAQADAEDKRVEALTARLYRHQVRVQEALHS